MGGVFFAPCVTRMVAEAAVEGTDLDIKLCLILVTGYVLDSGWPTFWGAMWDGRPRLAPSLGALARGRPPGRPAKQADEGVRRGPGGPPHQADARTDYLSQPHTPLLV